jgi:hypothetical protein
MQHNMGSSCWTSSMRRPIALVESVEVHGDAGFVAYMVVIIP